MQLQQHQLAEPEGQDIQEFGPAAILEAAFRLSALEGMLVHDPPSQPTVGDVLLASTDCDSEANVLSMQAALLPTSGSVQGAVPRRPNIEEGRYRHFASPGLEHSGWYGSHEV